LKKTTENPYTLSLHDALPICAKTTNRSTRRGAPSRQHAADGCGNICGPAGARRRSDPDVSTSDPESILRGQGRAGRCLRGQCPRSEEHTSELQSRENIVCRLL